MFTAVASILDRDLVLHAEDRHRLEAQEENLANLRMQCESEPQMQTTIACSRGSPLVPLPVAVGDPQHRVPGPGQGLMQLLGTLPLRSPTKGPLNHPEGPG